MKIKSNAVKGFTLIEMMMTLTIAAILLTVAVPSFNAFTKNSKITKQVNLLAASVSMARGEAAKRGARIVMCQSTNPTATTDSPPSVPPCDGTSGTWSNGWVVFVDSDNDLVVDAVTDVVGVFQTEPGVNIKTTTGTTIAFNPDGSTTSGAQSFAVCDNRGVNYGKQLDVAGTGRPSMGAATSCG
ncbi:GspH/FimT family pseudopilin [Kaarinaea lacus]